MPESVRRFPCAGCRKEVIICPPCDRNQQYCPGDCARDTRRRLQREANHRYQRTFKGRLKSAERSRRYRDRRRNRQRVTDQGSLCDSALDLLNASATNAVAETSSNGLSSPIASSESGVAIDGAVQCSFCSRWCPPWYRPGPLRRRSPRSGYIRRERRL
jgi:hypothetical protein